MSFPTMTHTWKFSSVGLTNVIPLPEGGGPYVIGMDKASGAYTGQLFWSPNLDASPLDDSWKALTDLNTTDEAGVQASNKDVRAIMGSITVRPTPALSGGIFTPIAKCEISLTPANSLGAQNRQRHASGYGANLIGGSTPVQDEYAALILADMGAVNGSFWSCQGGDLVTIADTGPSGIDVVDAGGGVIEADGPWEGSKSFDSAAGGMEYGNAAWVSHTADGEAAALEGWFRRTTSGAAFAMECGVGGIWNMSFTGPNPIGGDRADGVTVVGVSLPADDPADPGAWVLSTAYSLGDRRRKIVENNHWYEVEVAGTSAGSEPTWPVDGTTVADGGTLVWRDLGLRTSFHDMALGATAAADGRTRQPSSATDSLDPLGEWFHCVAQRTSLAMEIYINGALADSIAYAAQTGQGGTPPRHEFATTSFACTRITLGAGVGGSNVFRGSMAYLAHYHRELTPAEILSHYDKGVELGL